MSESVELIRTATEVATLRVVLRLTAVAVALAVLATGCTSSTPTHLSTPVRELHSISDLQERFNADSGHVRLILLISPT